MIAHNPMTARKEPLESPTIKVRIVTNPAAIANTTSAGIPVSFPVSVGISFDGGSVVMDDISYYSLRREYISKRAYWDTGKL